MKAIERLEKLLDQKDAELRKLQDELEHAQYRIDASVWGEWLPEDLPPVQALPVPRLEMLLDRPNGRTWRWRYRLVTRHFLGHCTATPMGRTTSTGSGNDWPPREFDGTLRKPFRDGAHIKHDAKALNMPAFIICGDFCETLFAPAVLP